MMVDLTHWRNEVLLGYVQFVQRDVGDAFSTLMETCSWRVILLLASWKQCELAAQQEKVTYFQPITEQIQSRVTLVVSVLQRRSRALRLRRAKVTVVTRVKRTLQSYNKQTVNGHCESSKA